MSPRSPRITAAELLRALKHDGWQQIRQTGSHVMLRHTIKPGRVTVPVTVPVHANVIIKPKTLEMILKQARLTSDNLRELL